MKQLRTHRLSRFWSAPAWLVTFLVPLLAHAQFGQEVVQGYGAPARDLPSTILFIVNFVLVLVGILALALLVYGGFRYIASRGEDDEVQAAKSIITNAVIGIVVIGIAAAIVNFVIGAVLIS